VSRIHRQLDPRHQLFSAVPEVINNRRLFCSNDPGKTVEFAVLPREGLDVIDRLALYNSRGNHGITNFDRANLDCGKKQ
jgi:hypothetical protein